MNITVEKIDDINLVLSGEIENSLVDSYIEKLKKESKRLKEETKKELENELKEDNISDEKLVTDALKSMDRDNYQRDAEGLLLKEFIEEGLKKANIPVDDILGQPNFKRYENREETIYLEIQIATAPKIDTSIEYMDIVPKFTKPKAPKEEVEAKLKALVIQQAPFTPIAKPRAVEDGDVVKIDFEGFVKGMTFEGGKAENFNLKVGSKSFIPGFEEQILGMEYGEERDIVVTFPKDYSATDLAGKECTFKVKLHEIQEQKYSEPDDAFAQKILNQKSATLEMLKAKLADQINSQALSNLYQEELKPKIMAGLVKKFDFTLPKNIVEQEIDAKVAERLQTMSKEEHEKLKKDKTLFHKLREEVRQEAEDAIKVALIVDALAKEKGIEVDEHEIQAALYYQAMMSGQDAEELVKYYKENNLMTSAKMGLTQDKLFGMMLGFDK